MPISDTVILFFTLNLLQSIKRNWIIVGSETG